MIPAAPGRAERIILLAFVSVVVVFNAVTLLPELTVSAPNVNDDAEHLLFVQRAAEALANGENPFDMWVPELDLGFPQFLYYQNLPHLWVVALHRLTGIDVTTLFNLVRYLLLVLFPLTVLWSLRRMGMPFRAAALAAAASPLLSGSFRYGFEYDSYVWRGFGMYTQLWAMHLAFVAVAAFWRVFQRGVDHRFAIVAFSALALSHLLYAYMTVLVVGVLFLVGLRRETIGPRLRSGAFVAGAVAVITSYMWIPFVVVPGYINESHGSPYVMTWMYDSFGAGQILSWLATGQLFDAGRLPVLTAFLALGFISAAVTRSRLAIVFTCVFAVGLVLYFGRPTIGAVLSLLPMQRALLFHRFVGIMDIAAIPLMGLGAALVWDLVVRGVARLSRLGAAGDRAGPVVAGLAIALCLGVAMTERARFYGDNTLWLTQTRNAIAADGDARQIIAAIRALPPGRVHAGMRNNWGAQMGFGLPFKGVRFHDLFVWERLPALAPPYRGASLNSDVIWDFREDLPSDYALFDVRYVILPATRTAQPFLTPLLRTPTYALYRAPGQGYGQYVPLASRQRVSSQASLISRNRQWFATEARTGAAIRWDYPAADDAAVSGPASGCRDAAAPLYENVRPARLEFIVVCANEATFMVKVTYHPSWRVTVDGAEVATFMLSPSYLGITLAPGGHTVIAEYRSLPAKAPLLAIGTLALLAIGASALPRRRTWLPRLGGHRRRGAPDSSI